MLKYIPNLNSLVLTKRMVVILTTKSLGPYDSKELQLVPQEEATTPPEWRVAPSVQLEKTKALHYDIKLPNPPDYFYMLSETEYPMLHVPGSFEFLWSKITISKDYLLTSRHSLRSTFKNLELVEQRSEFKEPIWLIIDLEFGKGKKPNDVWSGNTNGLLPAASEVLSALIQFPNLPRHWPNNMPMPNFPGYKLKKHLMFPRIKRDDILGVTMRDNMLEFNVADREDEFPNWASPSIREWV